MYEFFEDEKKYVIV